VIAVGLIDKALSAQKARECEKKAKWAEGRGNTPLAQQLRRQAEAYRRGAKGR
jgi:hypothetical protein